MQHNAYQKSMKVLVILNTNIADTCIKISSSWQYCFLWPLGDHEQMSVSIKRVFYIFEEIHDRNNSKFRILTLFHTYESCRLPTMSVLMTTTDFP